VKSVKAFYTQEARDAHIEGTVLLAVVVNKDGNVGDVAIERSLDPTYGLDDEAIKAAKQWLFTPGTKDGAAVAVRVHLEMTFTLK
jgi:protein TonB